MDVRVDDRNAIDARAEFVGALRTPGRGYFWRGSRGTLRQQLEGRAGQCRRGQSPAEERSARHPFGFMRSSEQCGFSHGALASRQPHCYNHAINEEVSYASTDLAFMCRSICGRPVIRSIGTSAARGNPGSLSTLRASRGSIARCNCMWMKAESPARLRSSCRTGSRSTSVLSGGAIKKPAAAWRPTRFSASPLRRRHLPASRSCRSSKKAKSD